MRISIAVSVSVLPGLVAFAISVPGCGGDSTSPPPASPEASYSFLSARRLASEYWNMHHISVADDGTTLLQAYMEQPGVITHFQEAIFPGEVPVLVPLSLITPGISRDHEHLIAVHFPSGIMETWKTAPNTSTPHVWQRDETVYSGGSPWRILRPKFTATADTIVAAMAREVSADTVLVLWHRDGGDWKGPDEILDEAGEPLSGLSAPCFSPGGRWLYAEERIPSGTRIVVLERGEEDRFVRLGPLGDEVNLPGYERVGAPFMAYDHGAFYFVATDDDDSARAGVFRVSVRAGS